MQEQIGRSSAVEVDGRRHPGRVNGGATKSDPRIAERLAGPVLEVGGSLSGEVGFDRFPADQLQKLRARIDELETVNRELSQAERSLAAEVERYRRVLESHPAPAASAEVSGMEASQAPEPAAHCNVGFDGLMAGLVPTRTLPVATQLRDLIAGSINAGSLRAGHRLPSIRSIADKFAVTPYAAMQAYATLEAEGIVDRRERSGIYVAPLDSLAEVPLPETADWLAGVLTQACDHQLRIPQLPELIRRWTSTAPVGCLCFDTCPDTAAALVHELSRRFGIAASPASREDLLPSRMAYRRPAGPPSPLRDTQLLVTTPFHSNEVRGFAESLGKPVLTATMNPEIVEAIEARVASHELVVICTSTVFGERIRELHGGMYRERIRPVLADDVDQAGVDLSQPVLVTHAARQQLGDRALRLIAPPFPFFSLDFARKVATVLLRLNLDAARG